SPEQARDPASAGPAADVYGLGATLYHAIQGEPPYGKGTNPAAILEKLDKGERCDEFAGSLSSTNIGLTDTIRRCMSPDPRDRFPEADALRAAFHDLLDGSADPSALLGPV
ncbi:hypothetical protein HY251_12535, partial [bacterium]|nr:hypothetical protein [bacterium]